MNILNPTNSWQAENLPAGLSIQDGVISGTPTVKGNFSVPVSVSNPLGSDTKNISIITKYRPGVEKFSILQDGVEVAKLSIPELQAMVQDGTAQLRFNCSNTQIVIPVISPALKYAKINNKPYNINPSYDACFFAPSVYNVPLNFCSFRDVTLQDNSVRPALILQFSQSLWPYYAPFDTGDSVDATPVNRWRYSNLRQWLNSEGRNWFVPAYDGDALVSYMDLAIAYANNYVSETYWGKSYNEDDIQSANIYKGWIASYADQDALGFLDLLPDDLHAILQPIKIVTQAFFDADNQNLSIEDPEDVDGLDADITFDKVFLPSIDEMFLEHRDFSQYGQWALPSDDPIIEGSAWEFYRSLFGTEQPFHTANYFLSGESYSDWGRNHQSDKIAAWGKNLQFNITTDITSLDNLSEELNIYNPGYLSWLTRSANVVAKNGVWTLGVYYDLCLIPFTQIDKDKVSGVSPAPAFAIC